MSFKTLGRNTLIGFIILGIIYFILYTWFDIPWMYFIFMATNDSVLVVLAKGISVVFSPESWTLAALITAVYAYRYHHKILPARTEALMRFSLTIIVTSILLTIVKIILGRYRPDMLLSENLYGFHFFGFSRNMQSTPSGHTTMAFCGFYYIARYFKKPTLTLILLFCALLVGLAKLVLVDHYVSDILFGGYFGMVCVIWIEAVLNRFQPKFRLSKTQS